MKLLKLTFNYLYLIIVGDFLFFGNFWSNDSLTGILDFKGDFYFYNNNFGNILQNN